MPFCILFVYLWRELVENMEIKGLSKLNKYLVRYLRSNKDESIRNTIRNSIRKILCYD